jgi:hypothetical protein
MKFDPSQTPTQYQRRPITNVDSRRAAAAHSSVAARGDARWRGRAGGAPVKALEAVRVEVDVDKRGEVLRLGRDLQWRKYDLLSSFTLVIQHSAFSIQHSALSIQHSALSTQRSPFAIRHSSLIS